MSKLLSNNETDLEPDVEPEVAPELHSRNHKKGKHFFKNCCRKGAKFSLERDEMI